MKSTDHGFDRGPARSPIAAVSRPFWHQSSKGARVIQWADLAFHPSLCSRIQVMSASCCPLLVNRLLAQRSISACLSMQSRMIRGRTLLRAFCCLSRRCPMAWRSRTLCVSGRQAADAISENWTPDEIRRLTIHRAGPGAAVASARVRRDEQHRVRSI